MTASGDGIHILLRVTITHQEETAGMKALFAALCKLTSGLGRLSLAGLLHRRICRRPCSWPRSSDFIFLQLVLGRASAIQVHECISKNMVFLAVHDRERAGAFASFVHMPDLSMRGSESMALMLGFNYLLQ